LEKPLPQLLFPIDAAQEPVLIPDADEDVIPGVKWGHCSELCSPAYWRAILLQAAGDVPKIRLGDTLFEETIACVLGGHGIPSEVGLAAFHLLRSVGFLYPGVSEEELFEGLSRPMVVNTRTVRYRFARLKSRYLAGIARAFVETTPPAAPLALRAWLLSLKGIGPKTASWIVRNHCDSDDVAILDIHIVRAGQYCGIFPSEVSLSSQYYELEQRFVAFSRALGVRTALLDACMWAQMKRSGNTLLKRLEHARPNLKFALS
jgi:N-glycosylase/DNA lyase